MILPLSGADRLYSNGAVWYEFSLNREMWIYG
jgi:hypothetical protein